MKADPAGIFASDVHRRIMAALPNPEDKALTIDELIVTKLNLDPPLLRQLKSRDEVVEALKDLEADGHATQAKGAWKNTKAGFELLTGPPIDDPDAETTPAPLTLEG